jgi:hypothetical protein
MKDETVTSTVSVEVIVVTKYGQHQDSSLSCKASFHTRGDGKSRIRLHGGGIRLSGLSSGYGSIGMSSCGGRIRLSGSDSSGLGSASKLGYVLLVWLMGLTQWQVSRSS